MKFDELIEINPNVRVADIIQLFLLGKDDKIYLNLSALKNSCDDNYLLINERIISEKWKPYYENKISWIEEECPIDNDLAELTLCINYTERGRK